MGIAPYYPTAPTQFHITALLQAERVEIVVVNLPPPGPRKPRRAVLVYLAEIQCVVPHDRPSAIVGLNHVAEKGGIRAGDGVVLDENHARAPRYYIRRPANCCPVRRSKGDVMNHLCGSACTKGIVVYQDRGPSNCLDPRAGRSAAESIMVNSRRGGRGRKVSLNEDCWMAAATDGREGKARNPG